jgi:hypothetical protein
VPRNKGSALDAYIDPKDLSESTSRLLIWQALQKYSVRALIPMLRDPEIAVRTSVARQLQIRGGAAAWAAAKKLCSSRSLCDRIVGLFLLSQLGTPRLPYKEEALDLIASLLSRRQPTLVMEQALYSVGHLRQGQALEHNQLLERIKGLKVRRGSGLAVAKGFALGRVHLPTTSGSTTTPRPG